MYHCNCRQRNSGHVLPWHRICLVPSTSASSKIRPINRILWQLHDLLLSISHVLSKHPQLPMVIFVTQIIKEVARIKVSNCCIVFDLTSRG